MSNREHRAGRKGEAVVEQVSNTYQPAKARVFQSGNSQAVRLPKQFRLKSKEVQIFRRGNDIVLRETPPKLSDVLGSLPPQPDDTWPDDIPDVPAEPLPRF
jgi:antitoxin VapB